MCVCADVCVCEGGLFSSSFYSTAPPPTHTHTPSNSFTNTPTPPFVPFSGSWRWQAVRTLLRMCVWGGWGGGLLGGRWIILAGAICTPPPPPLHQPRSDHKLTELEASESTPTGCYSPELRPQNTQTHLHTLTHLHTPAPPPPAPTLSVSIYITVV